MKTLTYLFRFFTTLAILYLLICIYMAFFVTPAVDTMGAFVIFIVCTCVFTLTALVLWTKIDKKKFQQEMETHMKEKPYLEQLANNILTEFRNETEQKKQDHEKS